MAKTSSTPKKKASEAPKKVTAQKKAVSTAVGIDTVNEQALTVLQQLSIEENLQSDIQWCLGSYRHDRNPVGLIDTSKRVLAVLKSVKAKNAKAVTAKVISDLQKVLKQ